jgi:signal transduction histidine kinase
LERKGVKLSVNLPDDLPPIYADSHEFTQVMFNLLQNARNHTENGSVTITAAERDDDNEEENSIIVTVSDTGSGIPPDILPDIFKRGVSGLEGGTGLGLPICKEIINSHGGDIKINSRHGTGTTVSFTIPIGKEGDNGGT